MKDHFAWEYKGKRKNLKDAYQQLQRYREDLLNPPLLVVCDLNRFEVHTNFTGTAKKVHAFDLDGLGDAAHLDVLRRLFTAPESLKPGQTAQALTEQASEQFGQLADGLRQRGISAHDAAHFLMKLMFCLFAEDIELLPDKLFTRVLTASKKDPARVTKSLRDLFAAMSTGGEFWGDDILYFNGGLFADHQVVELAPKEIEVLQLAAQFDWSSIEPSIFGTLFERTLDPGKRSQIGAHYTSREDIETLLRPVMLTPLRREWDAVKEAAEKQWENVVSTRKKATDKPSAKASPAEKRFERIIHDFVDRLSHVTVLDPACGSGNFLYVALHMLLDLEKEVVTYAAKRQRSLTPKVSPTQLAGLEINPYAAELAQVAIWIGYLQWMRDNGYAPPSDPVLKPIESIRQQDAILDLSDPQHPREPEWPEAEFIVGNPPFLGDKKMRLELGDEYVEVLRRLYAGRLPGQSDLCCYWLEKSRQMLEAGKSKRAGLLGTQGIRGGANRVALQRILETGDIFFAVSDRDWILDGATVHISMIGFTIDHDEDRILDGKIVSAINANLTATADTTKATRISANQGRSFIGAAVHGPFDLDESTAIRFLTLPNVHGKPNSDVIRTWANALTITKRELTLWMVDVPPEMNVSQAAFYEEPFEFLRENVLPVREMNRRPMRRKNWWILGDPQKSMRSAIAGLPRFILTPRVSKHRLFVFATLPLLATDATVAFARSDDYFFGVLHSQAHEVWALKLGTQLESRPRYTPTTCFETFPFPEPTDVQRDAIAAAAKELDRLRSNWLNPPELVRTEVLEFAGSVGGPWDRYIDKATIVLPNPPPLTTNAIGVVKYPRLVPKDEESAKELKKRTLTNLYNQRPTWLRNVHAALDAAVFAAYGWDVAITDDDLLARLLALNLARAGAP